MRDTTEKVTYFKPRGLFKKAIGTHVGADGKSKTTIWWLGTDKLLAIDRAKFIAYTLSHYRNEAAEAGTEYRHWNPADVVRIKAELAKMTESRWSRHLKHSREIVKELEGLTSGSTTPQPTPPSRVTTPTPAPAGQTLYAAADAYQEAVSRKRVSASHRGAVQYMVTRLKKDFPDMPMTGVDFAFLDKLADHYKSRPKMRNGEQMSAATVKHILGSLRTFFVWCDDVEFGGWRGPRKLLKPSRVVTTDLLTAAERRIAATIEQFTPAELRRLYQHASEQTKSWILGGLFFAATQFELSEMVREEFDLDAAIVDHARTKTGITGRFWIPPELVTMLKSAWATKPDSTAAFTTEHGGPLVKVTEGHKCSDAVRLAWMRLRITAGLPDALPFKYLRKFAADYARKGGGEAMAQVALSHSRQTVASKHYTSGRDFEAFHKVQQQMHNDLTAAGMFTPFTPEELDAHARTQAGQSAQPKPARSKRTASTSPPKKSS